MTFPTNKLKNPYYFLKDNVVYEISNVQDEDNCGQHFVTFKTTSLDGEDKVFVKKGNKYLDSHGTPTVAPSDGYYNVSTGQLDIEPNLDVFPWICIQYKSEIDDTKIKEEYLWLDYLIDDGDQMADGKFVMNTNHAPEGGSYVEYYKQSVLDLIGRFYANGYTETNVKRNFPDYFFAEQYGENIPEDTKPNIVIDNKKVYLVSILTSEGNDIHLTEDDMMDAFYKCCNEQVVTYANKLLKPFDKQLKGTTETAIPVIVSKDTVEDINDGETPDPDAQYYAIYLPTIMQNGTLTVSAEEPIDMIKEGTRVSIMATPDDGYMVSSFKANGQDIPNPYSWVMTEDVVFEVTFAESEDEPDPDEPTILTYRLIVPDRITGGTVTVMGYEDLTAVPVGTRMSVTVTPQYGFETAEFTANGNTVRSPYIFDMPEEDVIINVQFRSDDDK